MPYTMTPSDPWLTRQAVAEWLGVEAQTLADWAHRGTGPKYARPTHGTVRYRKSDVLAWMEASLRTKSS